MAGERDLRHLLEVILDSGKSPEEVCQGDPELLAEVQARLRYVRLLEAQLDVLLPSSSGPDAGTAAPRPWTAQPPHLSGYEVQDVLGRGGMGVVYRAWDQRLHRPVALKMLLAGDFARPDERERFRREAEAAAGLRHANIVQVYDVGDLDGRPYFTMEFVEGGSLAEKLAGAPLAGRPGRRAPRHAGGGRAGGPRPRDRPPRPEAGQRPLDRRRHPQDRRLRVGPAAGGSGGADPQRHSAGHAELHGPGAGPGPDALDRTGRGRLRAGGDSVRGADGTTSIPGGHNGGDAAASRRTGADAPLALEREGPAQPGGHLPEVPAQGAAPPLPERRRAGGGPPPLRAGRARSRPARRACWNGRPGGWGAGGSRWRPLARRAAGGRAGRRRPVAQVGTRGRNAPRTGPGPP